MRLGRGDLDGAAGLEEGPQGGLLLRGEGFNGRSHKGLEREKICFQGYMRDME